MSSPSGSATRNSLNELVAIFGNFVNRAVVLTHKYFGGLVPGDLKPEPVDAEALAQIQPLKEALADNLEHYKFREALKLPLIYVGGLVSRPTIDKVLNHGFEFVQMGRALINEPDFVNRMKNEDEVRCGCDHTNYCIARMYSIEMACHKHLEGQLPPCIVKEIEKIHRHDPQ